MISISELNSLSRIEFVRVIGPVFEHSPWIADLTWEKRPFANREHLLRALCETVGSAGASRHVELIRAHPDLVGRAALAGTLTPASSGEQASAGLDKLSPDEIATFQRFNAAYRDKFGFPFVICARLNKKDAIVAGFELRLHNSRETEIQTAIDEIFKIAGLRLNDVVADA